MTNKLREDDEGPDAGLTKTLTVENTHAHPVRIMRLKCVIEGADEERVVQMEAHTDITPGVSGGPVDLPKNTTKVTVVYDRWDWANKRFPKRPVESRPTAVEGLKTRVKIK